MTVTDPEDASIDCNRVTVTFVLVHDQHGHGEASADGLLGRPADVTGRRGARRLHRRRHQRVVHGHGRRRRHAAADSTNTQHVVQLARQHVEYVQAAAGIQFSGVAAPETDPLGGLQSANQLDPGDWMLLNNRYQFDGVERARGPVRQQPANNTLRGHLDVRLDAVDGPVAATCELRATGGNGVYREVSCPFTGATGSHRVYLTFRQATGGPATGFGLINWVEFRGPGV